MPTLNNVDQIRNQIYRILRDSYPEALSVRKIQEKLFEQGFIDITSDKVYDYLRSDKYNGKVFFKYPFSCPQLYYYNPSWRVLPNIPEDQRQILSRILP